MSQPDNWWQHPYNDRDPNNPQEFALELGWEEHIGDLTDMIGQLWDEFVPDEIHRIMGCAGMLFSRHEQWWTKQMDEDPDALMAGCLWTAMVWERG